MAHYECKYCDRPEGLYGIPITVGDEQICVCGAEWADAKILIEDEEISPQEQREIDEMYRQMEEEEEMRIQMQELEEDDDYEDGSAYDEPDEFYTSHKED